jgi:V8-like Glu-specific endopeptidase
MTKQHFTAAVATLVTCLFAALPASAITHGDLDGANHPAVVLVLMEVNFQPAFRCSGTLITPTIVLTAGHCAGAPGEFSGIRVFVESDVQSDPTYPFAGGPNTIEATAFAAHPDFTSAAFFLHDVGMIKLASPVNLPASQYGTLPTVNSSDALPVGQKTHFTSVGYGLQRINPAQVVSQRIRMFANPFLIQKNTGLTGPFSLLLSNNASSGGTCFGDSGGPNFLGDSMVVAGVTSFGLNGTCGGTGGVFRLDRADVQAFINNFIADHP